MKPSKMRLGTTLVTVAALGVLAGACSSSSKSSSTTTPATSAPVGAVTTIAPSTSPAALTITAADYTYTGLPATLPAGIQTIKFVNTGSVSHEMAFVKVTSNADPKALLKSLGSQAGAPIPKNFLSANGVHDTPAGHTTNTQFNLTPGQYVALCFDTGIAGSTKDGPPHFMRGMYKTLTVTGTGGATPPTAESTLTAHDYGFDTSGLKAGTQTIVFKNTGPVQWHFADINVFPKGVTVAQAQAAATKLLAAGNGPPPAGVPQPAEVATSQVASPGWGNTFTATLEKGRTYIVLCFFSDRSGGPPHAIGHHMYKVFTVS